MRVGIGYDVHKLVLGRKLILGGEQIDYARGLDGHSDADVLTHAIMDALLGAAGLGDIGVHFPDSDSTYKDASSIELLTRVGEKLYSLGYEIVNIDCVIITQEPKLKDHMGKMKNNISAALGLGVEKINIKATTTEHLGFEGRKEGISSQAICLIK